MKQSLQLRLGQQLTMTPQLQQAIRLLQLSTLDLKQEIQEALDSNMMLETEEEGAAREELNGSDGQLTGEAQESARNEISSQQNDAINEKEVNAESADIPQELAVDSGWDDVYESSLPPASGVSGHDKVDTDYLTQRRTARTLFDYLVWQLNLTPFNDTDRAIATTIIDGISEDGYLVMGLEEIVSGLSIEEVGIEEVEAVLHRIQQFDPPGVGARDPRECLLLQLN